MSPKYSHWLKGAWSIICWIAISGLVALVAAALYFVQRADAKLRDFTEAKLAELYPHLTVQCASAQLVQGEGVRLRQISFAKPARNQLETRTELAYAESVTIQCDTRAATLLQGQLRIRQVLVDGLVIHLRHEANGKWNLSEFAPIKFPPCSNRELPVITIENGSIVLDDAAGGQQRVTRADGLRLRVRLKRPTSQAAESVASQSGLPLAITTPATPSTGGPIPHLLVAIDGWFHTEWCRRIHLEGIGRTSDRAWTLRGEVEGFNWSHEAVDRLPAFVSEKLSKLRPLRANLDGRFELHQNTWNAPLEFGCHAQLSGGQWHDDQLPQPLTGIAMEIQADSQGWSIPQATARFGEATLSGQATGRGYGQRATFSGQVQFEQFPVTSRLAERLPSVWHTRWAKVQPEGIFSGTVDVSHNGSELNVAAEVDCEDTSLVYYKFPYPITKCQGKVTWKDQVLGFQLKGLAGTTPVTLQGDLHNPGPRFTGNWEVRTKQWKTIDETLIAALPPGAAQVLRDMQLRGEAGCSARLTRTDPDVRAFPDVTIAVRDAWVNYRNFPYPISKIHGRVVWREGLWTFENLQGRNDECQILCNGSWTAEDPEKPLALEFEMERLVLDTELRQALPSQGQEVWAQLRPQGQLDQVAVRVWKTKSLLRPEVDVKIRQLATTDASPQEGLQLYPAFFPLKISNVTGDIDLIGNQLTMREVAARNGNTTIRLNGKGTFNAHGGWSVELDDMAADRIQTHGELLQALPPRLSRSMQRLQVDGSFGLAGKMNFKREEAGGALESGWDIALNVEQGQMRCGLPLQAIFGQIELKGQSRDDSFWTRGQLQVDSLMAAEKVQLTRVSGPLWIDNHRAILGQRVPPSAVNQATRPIAADIYGGRLSANLETTLDEEADFSLQANLTNAEMATMARDWRLGQGQLAGKAFLELALRGNTRGRHTWEGQGTAQLREANLLELPIVLALLSRLSSGRRDNTAFTECDVAFRISQEYVYFDRFDLTGDAITLKGLGEMSLNRDLDLDFYSIMGREQLWSPLVRPFLGEASKQFLLIHVNGTLSEPQTTQEVLPRLNESLQQLFPEQYDAATETRPTPPPAAVAPRRSPR